MTDLSPALGPRLNTLLTDPDQRQTAATVFKLIAATESADIARAWLIGENPRLGDRAPLLAIRDGQADAVLCAARCYIEEGR